MHELERIEHALATQDLDPTKFERCAQDLLSETYPGLSPIPGGTDWGRDADLHDGMAQIPPRLMVTKSREQSGIRANMIGGLESLKEHNVAYDRIVIANPGSLSETQRNKLREDAAAKGAKLVAIYDRGFFGSALRRDGEWRKVLLGLSGVPITVSRMPQRLAESPWAHLPLVGRDDILSQIADNDTDIILVGKPGVGKTRLLAEIPNAVFVDPDADRERLADDIRWLHPEVIVIDDVSTAPTLARYLQRLRLQESDWLGIRLIVACWPDEVDSIRDLLPNAVQIDLDLLERPEVDKVVQAMGISGITARRTILDQAEGRPGWAVTLADLLLGSDWKEVVTGKAIIGQIDGYLRRSQLSIQAKDLLAIIAALRGVQDSDLKSIATITGVTRPEVGRLLRAVAQGGLLDVSRQYARDGEYRVFTVRPPMLAEAIATEHYFLSDVPLGDIEELVEKWPGYLPDLVVTTCIAAILGSDQAANKVDRMVEEVLQNNPGPALAEKIFRYYLSIDERRAVIVLEWITAEFDQLTPEQKSQWQTLQSIVGLAHTITSVYLNRNAIKLLLDIALHDARPTNPNPSHPLRAIEDLCIGAHPDSEPSIDKRVLVASVLSEWIPAEPNPGQWRVWTAVAKSVLTPRISGSFTSPESVRSLSLVETIVTPQQAQLIKEQLWRVIYNRLPSCPDTYIAKFVDIAHEWLYAGSGNDRPFGNAHPDESIAEASVVGRSMLEDLIELSAEKIGLAVRVASTASVFDIPVPASVTEQVQRSPFFRDVELVDNLHETMTLLQTDIAADVADWANEPPEVVVARLIDLRTQSDVADVRWPRRVMMACESLAKFVEIPRTWVEEALKQGLFPDAAPFIKVMVSANDDSTFRLVADCIQDPAARGHTLEILLRDISDERLQNLAITEMDATDFDIIELLVIRGELRLAVQEKIFERGHSGARAALALALVGREDPAEVSIPEQIRESFLSAALELNLENLPPRAHRPFAKMLLFLSTNYPDVAEQLIVRRLTEREHMTPMKALGSDGADVLHKLPPANKTSLFRSLGDNSAMRFMILEDLVGPDEAWLDHILTEGYITPDEALSARRFDNHLTIAQMAKLLVPRGIDPAQIASLGQSGSWVGEQSDHYSALIEEFRQYEAADDPSIAAVGSVGVEMFSRARDEALARERQRRIRGEG
ncbi:hypothetical protein [Nocardia nova]